jgi:thiol-disulfide isomerase/thioredoxin
MRIITLFILLLSASHATAQLPADVDAASLVKDFRNWWNYYNAYTPLASDFIPLDAQHNNISRGVFLDSLVTGHYIPQRVPGNEKIPTYKLLLLGSGDATLDIRNIRATIQTVAYEESRNFSLEGQFLPPYDFIDLKGKRYTNANTKNKLLVLKYWFINCVPCVEEMPELNQLLKRYRGRKDLLFVSVAMDGPAELRSFLLSHQFNYAVVPGQKTWLTNIMEARSYPTHIVVDKGGKIVKVVNTAHALKAVLSKTLAQ